jgi:transposase
MHRHIRGKWACHCCESIPAPGLLAQVVVAKYDDHLLLYRQQEIYARSGAHIARSSMAQWVDICGVRLQPLRDPGGRDAGVAAGAGQGQDASGVCVGVSHD